jgi:hypothetical protein
MSSYLPYPVHDLDAVIQEQPLPPLLVGFYDPDGNLVMVSEQPDNRLLYCRSYNEFSQGGRGGLTARPIALVEEVANG